MRETLKDLYYGNIKPCEQGMSSQSGLCQAANRSVQCERQLSERLGETDQALLNELMEAQQEICSTTALESFIMGFRLGVRIMAECMDGDARSITNQR